MALVVKCPNPQCGKTYRLSDDAVGRRVKCQSCGEKFEAEAVEEAAPAEDGRMFQVQRVGDVTFVTLTVSRISTENIAQMGEELQALAEDESNKKVVLSLAAVKFLFSTALGQIVALENKLSGQGGSLRLCELQPVVQETMESSGLTIVLDIYESRDEALAGF